MVIWATHKQLVSYHQTHTQMVEKEHKNALVFMLIDRKKKLGDSIRASSKVLHFARWLKVQWKVFPIKCVEDYFYTIWLFSMNSKKNRLLPSIKFIENMIFIPMIQNNKTSSLSLYCFIFHLFSSIQVCMHVCYSVLLIYLCPFKFYYYNEWYFLQANEWTSERVYERML